jgi:general secretion pathway protein C
MDERIMETLVKRHFWVINLLALGVIAWLVAGSVNAAIGVLLAKSGRSDEKVNIAPASGETRVQKRLTEGRLHETSGAEMQGRSVFWIEEPAEAEPEPEPEEGPGGEGPGAEQILEATYEPTTLPIKLLGTMVVKPAAFSSGSVEIDKKEQKVVSVGTVLLDGKAEVVLIARNYLVLKEDHKLTIAPLFTGKEGEAAAVPGQPGQPTPPTPPPTMDRSPRPSTPPAAMKSGDAAGVKKVGEGSYKLDRAHVNDKLKDVTKLGGEVRPVPNYRNGKYDGVKMMGMNDSSLFKEIGFENGDILQSVNGERMDSPNKALALYEALKNKSRLTVLIEREGIAKTLRYTVGP